MENFCFPQELKNMLIQYYISFYMRFLADKVTTEWQRLEVGITTGCTISVILFILVMNMEMIQRLSIEEATLMTPLLKAFVVTSHCL